MTTRLIALAVLVACTTGPLAEEPKLINATRVFPTSHPTYKRSNQHHAFTLRLSPDGKHLLYTRPVAGSEQSDDESARLDGDDETARGDKAVERQHTQGRRAVE